MKTELTAMQQTTNNKFKVGDWITIEGTLPNDRFKLTEKEIKYGEVLLAHFSFTEDTWKHWKPQPGEWCWYGQKLVKCKQSKMIKYRKAHETDFKNIRQTYIATESDSFYVYDYELEPFIGTLPSFIKDRQ